MAVSDSMALINHGGILGLDKNLLNGLTIGADYQHDKSKIDGYKRETYAEANIAFAYAEYRYGSMRVRYEF